MTTIVANRECMAADTRVVGAGAMYHSPKLFRIGTSIFGTAGDAMMGLIMVEWLRTPQRNRKQLYGHWNENTDRSECILMELNPSGLYLWNGWGVPEKVMDKSYSIGSGSMSALIALHRGATPEEAVRAAMPVDENTGGDVQVEWLLPPELAKPRRKRG